MAVFRSGEADEHAVVVEDHLAGEQGGRAVARFRPGGRGGHQLGDLGQVAEPAAAAAAEDQALHAVPLGGRQLGRINRLGRLLRGGAQGGDRRGQFPLRARE
ncbi:hypothetical protein WKI68_38065 [Streptomyces sp. MS1.HAVA.3]|uniref:Uncharacterized protein n=1 Tax=Streptomyces caledonius TaxID=3134107 RepID=A0ABU8UC46_9ACTN